MAFVCRLCVGTCVRERGLHRVIQETRIGCMRAGLEALQTSGGAGETARAEPPSRKHTGATQGCRACLEASGRCCVGSGFESRAGITFWSLFTSLSAACTVADISRGMESKKKTWVGDAVTAVTEAERVF